MNKVKDPDDLRLWLKGRANDSLRVCSNPMQRTIGFADVSTSEYVICDISTFLRDRPLYKRYVKVKGISQAADDGAMLEYWLFSIVGRDV